MIKINIEIPQIDNLNLNNDIQELIKENDLDEKLKEALEKEDMTIKISLEDNNKIKITKVEEDAKSVVDTKALANAQTTDAKTTDTKTTDTKSITDTSNKKETFLKKLFSSSCRIFEELFDSIARKFLKEKYKWNYSVYNNGKKAYKALKDSDVKTFVEKGSDAILYTIKSIPAETKKVIKNTKNVAIEEVFSWNKT